MSEEKFRTINDDDYEPTADDIAIARRIIELRDRRDAERQASIKAAVQSPDDRDPPLNDTEFKDLALARFRHLIDVYSAVQTAYAREAEKIDEILAAQPSESVYRAAVCARPSDDAFKAEIGLLTQITSDLERLPTVLAVIEEERNDKSRWSMFDTMNRLGQEHTFQRMSEKLAELRSTVDALKFAATADQERAKKASDAMGKILSGVTVLQKMGFEISEIQATVDDYIGLRTRQEFTLLGRVVSDGNSYESNKNIDTANRKREELIAQNKWVRGFLNRFWLGYWRNAFEQSSQDEHEVNVLSLVAVMPSALDELKKPMDKWTIGSVARSEVERRRANGEMPGSRVRFRYEHEREALVRLMQAADPNAPKPMDVVQVEVPNDVDPREPNFWTRQRAEAAGLKIVPPENVISPNDDTY